MFTAKPEKATAKVHGSKSCGNNTSCRSAKGVVLEGNHFKELQSMG